MNQPLFFKHKLEFVGNLPKTARFYSQEDIDNIPALVTNYLRFYKIHALKDGHCQAYSIWSSNISTQYDDIELNYTIVQQYWQVQQPIGTVIMVHGYMDHTGLYGRLLNWALSSGFNVIGFDLPGHGLSSGKIASIDHFDRYSQIFDSVIEQLIDLDKIAQPFYAIGQSTGCAVIANSLIQQSNHSIKRAVLLAPLVRSFGWSQTRWLYFLLKHFTKRIMRKFGYASHNQYFNDFLAKRDPIQSPHIPLQWLGAMENWYQWVKHYPTNKACNIPITVIQGKGDMTVDWRYNLPALSKLFMQYDTHYIDKARHQLINESERYWQDIEVVLNNTLLPKKSLTSEPLD